MAATLKVRERKIPDMLRGYGEREITVRFDSNDTVTLPSHCNYYNDGRPYNDHIATIPRKIEAKEGASWKPYPSVSWIDGSGDIELYTAAIVKMPDGSFEIKSSPMGCQMEN